MNFLKKLLYKFLLLIPLLAAPCISNASIEETIKNLTKSLQQLTTILRKSEKTGVKTELISETEEKKLQELEREQLKKLEEERIKINEQLRKQQLEEQRLKKLEEERKQEEERIRKLQEQEQLKKIQEKKERLEKLEEERKKEELRLQQEKEKIDREQERITFAKQKRQEEINRKREEWLKEEERLRKQQEELSRKFTKAKQGSETIVKKEEEKLKEESLRKQKEKEELKKTQEQLIKGEEKRKKEIEQLLEEKERKEKEERERRREERNKKEEKLKKEQRKQKEEEQPNELDQILKKIKIENFDEINPIVAQIQIIVQQLPELSQEGQNINNRLQENEEHYFNPENIEKDIKPDLLKLMNEYEKVNNKITEALNKVININKQPLSQNKLQILIQIKQFIGELYISTTYSLILLNDLLYTVDKLAYNQNAKKLISNLLDIINKAYSDDRELLMIKTGENILYYLGIYSKYFDKEDVGEILYQTQNMLQKYGFEIKYILSEPFDPYEILEVNKNATDNEIRKAYRKLGVEWHPDRNPENREAANIKFKAIEKAYQAIKTENDWLFYQISNAENYEIIPLEEKEKKQTDNQPKIEEID